MNENTVSSRYQVNSALLILIPSIFALIRIFIAPTLNNHLVVVSATYYKKSPIYKPETVIILLNGPESLLLNRPLFCIAQGETKNNIKVTHAVLQYAYEPVGICKWTTFLAECAVFDGFKNITLTQPNPRSKSVNIPLRTPYKPKQNGTEVEVANCFSPFFYNEHWQLVLTSLELFKHFGSQLQIYYIQSMLESITNVLRKYQELGFVELEPWPQFKLGENSINEIGFDPNYELDWRNQATAHTDCLLKYREAAKFIIFGDVDDIFVPKLGPTYIAEFNFLSQAHENAAGFTYNRYNTMLESTSHPEHFSLENSITGAHIANEWEDGKYVVNTSRVETAWIHYPGIYDKRRFKMFTVPEHHNFMFHLRNWTIYGNDSDNSLSRAKQTAKTLEMPFKFQINDLISLESIVSIERNFRSFFNKRWDVFRHLPTRNYYLPLIIKCYDRIFYSRAKLPESCPGPLKCNVPLFEDLKCSVAKRPFDIIPINLHTTFYVAQKEAKLISNQNGCYL